jgi:hypothetical protein
MGIGLKRVFMGYRPFIDFPPYSIDIDIYMIEYDFMDEDVAVFYSLFFVFVRFYLGYMNQGGVLGVGA